MIRATRKPNLPLILAQVKARKEWARRFREETARMELGHEPEPQGAEEKHDDL